MAVSKNRRNHKQKVQQRNIKIVVQKKKQEKHFKDLIEKYNAERETAASSSFQDNFRYNFSNVLNKGQ